jgi:ATP-dependent Clp protease protease subunit
MLRSAAITLIWAALATLQPAIFAQDRAQNGPTASNSDSSESLVPSELRAERDRLVIENQIRDEALRKELADQHAELQRLKIEGELAKAKVERESLLHRVAVEKAQAEMSAIDASLALESARLKSGVQKELAALRAAKERMELEAEVAQAELSRKSSEYKAQEVAWNGRLAELRSKVAQREQEMQSAAYVDQGPVYTKDPVAPNGDLVISDRRIPLNGVITAETGDFVCSRIDFYNNKSQEFPIFIVIDESPGGSVMAGYKILKSMQSSTAPVYVVVKSYAASMAAAICTMAQRSFAYPNAIIIHHQISNGLRGNLAAQREGVKMLEEWWQRLAQPIATKMGISVEEFSTQMYAHSSTGDWQEFADNAVKLKWVDVVVGRCQETALVKNPDSERGAGESLAGEADLRMAAKPSAQARPAAVLPRLSPLDCYYLFNPDGYFRSE